MQEVHNLESEGRSLMTDQEREHIVQNENGEQTPVPWKAALYSMLFPGLGQIYNGDMGRGSYYFVIAFILIVSAYLVIPVIIFIFFWLYNIYQAFNYARDKQDKNRIEDK
jgi:TM2 domain-containing membrane protein YozV